jgi:hypothetical protein
MTPVSWASLLIVASLALAIAGAGVIAVASVAAFSLVVETCVRLWLAGQTPDEP